MQLCKRCHFLSKREFSPLTSALFLSLKTVKILPVVEIRRGIRLTGPGFFIILLRFLLVPQFVIAHTQLHVRNIIIAVRKHKPVRIFLFRNTQCGFIPINCIMNVSMFQEMPADFTAQFRPRQIKAQASQKRVQRCLLLPHFVIAVCADRACLYFIFNPSRL